MGDYSCGEVLWCYQFVDVNWFFDGDDVVFWDGGRDGIFVNMGGFFIELFKEIGCVGYFVFGIGCRFVVFLGDEGGEVVGVFDDEVVLFVEEFGVFMVGFVLEGFECGFGVGDGEVGVFCGEFGVGVDQLFCGWVVDFKGFVGFGGDLFFVDIVDVLFEEGGVLKLGCVRG